MNNTLALLSSKKRQVENNHILYVDYETAGFKVERIKYSSTIIPILECLVRHSIVTTNMLQLKFTKIEWRQNDSFDRYPDRYIIEHCIQNAGSKLVDLIVRKYHLLTYIVSISNKNILCITEFTVTCHMNV